METTNPNHGTGLVSRTLVTLTIFSWLVVSAPNQKSHPSTPPGIMNDIVILAPQIAAIGYSLVYLLFGGGIGGAILIFIIAKLLRK